MNKDYIIITAIGCITAMEMTALIMGHNGTLLKISMVVIAGLAGWRIPSGVEK